MSEYRKILHRLAPFRHLARDPVVTECLLVRHASFDYGKAHLAGRSEWPLSRAGRSEAAGLIDLLPYSARVVQSSPRRRAIETIVPYAASIGRSIQAFDDLDEIDYGAWTGMSFDDLARDPLWSRWNAARAETTPPGGESMRAAQARIVRHLTGLPNRFHGTVVIVTHAELIRAAILHCRGLPLGAWSSVDVPLASVTTIRIAANGTLRLERGPETARATGQRPSS